MEVHYTSCACNSTPTAADWGLNNLVAYASCNSVRIYDPGWGSGGKITSTLCKHTKRVNSVKWLRGDGCETELVSGSSDGATIVWSFIGEKYVSNVLDAESSVNLVDGLYKDNNRKNTVVIAASIDCCIRIWRRFNKSDGFFLNQKLDAGYLCTGLSVTLIPNSDLLMFACGRDDSKIQLYTETVIEDLYTFANSQVLVGHENWVRGLDFTKKETDLILLSSSQDALIIVWRITVEDSDKKELFAELDLDKEIVNKIPICVRGKYVYYASLEATLISHEAWVYSVRWNPKKFTFLSASLDKTMIIWEYDEDSKTWMEQARLGEVGGGNLGFYGAVFSSDGLSVIGCGYQGAFHYWKFSEETGKWDPAVTVSGHFNAVVDLGWEPKGEFIVSVSEDQTTRVHAPWTLENQATTWHEIARPQVHGFDMSCLAIISRYSFASGAEEKVIRTFRAPFNFTDNFRRLCRIEEDESITDESPRGASVPSLGLSNKAVYDDDNIDRVTAKSSKDPYSEESHFTAVALTEPPTEATLLQNTLWPEVRKLYGHGYEVFALAASPDGLLLASACKSTTMEHSAILLWDTTTWKLTQKLLSHGLTVVQLAFSPDSKYLLSVSRDRRWSLFVKSPESKLFERIATTDKKTAIHARIIWCCAWTHDSKYFTTGSRDGKVVVWTCNPNKAPETVLGQCEAVGEMLELKGESVTALAFAPMPVADGYLLAVGLDVGNIILYCWNAREWRLIYKLDGSQAHHLTVRRLAFRPVLGRAGESHYQNTLQLASCGSDHTIRVYNIDTNSCK